MINQFNKYIHQYWFQFFKNRSICGNPQQLTAKNIYILPSKFGWLYGVVTLTLFSAAINYQISTIFLLTFLLAVSGLISAWEAHANLKNLSIKLLSINDTQQEEPAQVNLFIQPQDKARFALEFRLKKQEPIKIAHVAQEGLSITMPLETLKRGRYRVPRITISTFFPFGLFRVWGYAYFNDYFYVYPKAISPGYWPAMHTNQIDDTAEKPGSDEFYELKTVQTPWSQPNRIAWKIAAKGQGWFHKTMTSEEGDYWLFQLSDFPMSIDLENRLHYLSYWLQQAESQGYIYSLKLNTEATDFARGKSHLKHCLRLLATYS